MNTISYTKARSRFAEVMNQVCQNHAPLIITRQNEQPIAMISLEDYNSIEESFYLIRSSNNAKRLKKSLKDLNTKQNFRSIEI